MWNTTLFFGTFLAALAAVMYGIPRQARAVAGLEGLAPRFQELLRRGTLGGLLQSGFLAAAGAALGTTLGRQAGLQAPLFEAIQEGSDIWAPLRDQLLLGLAAGLLGGLVFIGLYYGFFRRRMGPEKAALVERLRTRMGLVTRVLMGGIFEEVVFRWGMMGAAAWAGVRLSGGAPAWVYWTANFLAAVLFALYHLPGLYSLGAMFQFQVERPMVNASLILNIFAGLIFGWLFWQYGLLAAILAHALFHILWHPLELRRLPPVGTASVRVQLP